MSDLTEFLLARIAEDDEWARFEAESPSRFDRARVLAECEAKRRIVALATGEGFDVWTGGEVEAVQRHLDAVLAVLALPYADHPDFDPAWAD